MERGGRGREEAKRPYHSSCVLLTPRSHHAVNLFAVSPTLCGAPFARVTPTGSLETADTERHRRSRKFNALPSGDAMMTRERVRKPTRPRDRRIDGYPRKDRQEITSPSRYLGRRGG